MLGGIDDPFVEEPTVVGDEFEFQKGLVCTRRSANNGELCFQRSFTSYIRLPSSVAEET